MAYRNGTYVAFHANGTNYPLDSDIKYYNLLKAWTNKGDDTFTLINSHEKTAAVRDTSKKETLARSLRERLNNSKNLLLIIGETTRHDDDWIPYEISYAVDQCKIPLIITYIGFDIIKAAKVLVDKWPIALKERIENGKASAIHIPFKKLPIQEAIDQFSHINPPKGGGYGIYNDEAYRNWGLL